MWQPKGNAPTWSRALHIWHTTFHLASTTRKCAQLEFAPKWMRVPSLWHSPRSKGHYDLVFGVESWPLIVRGERLTHSINRGALSLNKGPNFVQGYAVGIFPHSHSLISLCNHLHLEHYNRKSLEKSLDFWLFSLRYLAFCFCYFLLYIVGALFKVFWREVERQEYSCLSLLVAWVGKQSILLTLPCMSYSPSVVKCAARLRRI